MGRLEGKTALVTGGASGIGEAICRRLSQEGAWVAVADLNEAKGVKLARELGKGSLFVKLDVTQEAEWQAAIETVTAQFGGLDILVNNAGMMKPGSIEDATLEDWRTAMTVNGEGVFQGGGCGDEGPHRRSIARRDHQHRISHGFPRSTDARLLQRNEGRGTNDHQVRGHSLRQGRLSHSGELRAARRHRHRTAARQHQAGTD